MIMPPTFASGVYWRRSRWNGARCVPAVLSLRCGRLRLAAARDVAFDAPCAEVTARFSRLHTMVLTVGGTRFDVVGIGSSLSPSFTPAQREELRALQAEAAGTAVSPTAGALGAGLIASGVGGGAGGALGAAADVTAVVGAFSDWGRLKATIGPWREVLPAAGVAVTP